jgi:hypothetical protein
MDMLIIHLKSGKSVVLTFHGDRETPNRFMVHFSDWLSVYRNDDGHGQGYDEGAPIIDVRQGTRHVVVPFGVIEYLEMNP